MSTFFSRKEVILMALVQAVLNLVLGLVNTVLSILGLGGILG